MLISKTEKPTLFFAKQVLPLVESNTAPRIIELGAGWCDFAAIAREMGYKTTVVDMDERKIERAKRLGFQVDRLDLNNPLPYGDSSFDGCVLLEVIEHIVKAEDLIKEISRILKKGAFLVLTTPNPAHYFFRLKALLGFPPREEGYHYRFFTKNKLLSLLQEKNFAIEIFKGAGYLPFINRIISKSKNYNLRLYLPFFLQTLFADRFFILAKNRKSYG